MPQDYSEPFWIDRPAGNNAFAYEVRGAAPRLWVPSLINGTIADVRRGDKVVFEDRDEHGVLQSCTGLRHLVKMEWAGIPAVVVDNHNHVFYFWYEARAQGIVQPGATLIHIDQHRDTRVPDRFYEGHTLEDAFEYTNFQLNVGDYILPAQRAGLVGETQFVTGEAGLRNLPSAGAANKILNIDLDFFAPEMSYIDFGLARRFIDAHLPGTSLITIATSPFFINQARAIEVLSAIKVGS